MFIRESLLQYGDMSPQFIIFDFNNLELPHYVPKKFLYDEN